jgi:hypothetical protein
MAETGPSDPDEIRRQLIALVEKKGKRKHEWSKDRPTDWRPGEVYDPEWKVYFTAPRAWELILQWLVDSRPVETKEMTLASGKTVWVHVMVEEFGGQMIYVKLEILPGGTVLGWSFHISERTVSKEREG